MASPLKGYQRTIAEIVPMHNARHVEAWMRSEYGTLDHLGRETFAKEARVAASCVDASTFEANEALAESFGIIDHTRFVAPLRASQRPG